MKRKVSVTLDEELVKSIEHISKERKIPRSRVVEEMLRYGEKMLIREKLKEGYMAMREEDRKSAEEIMEAQKEVMDE